jgi:uncharacterized protein YdeI (BOF family)
MKWTIVVLVSMLLGLTACKGENDIIHWIDKAYFYRTGKLLLANSVELTTKEIHLDNGGLNGKNILLKGDIVQLGEYDTYFVLVDESGRMLVLTTKVPEDELTVAVKQKVKVWGVLERGKKGLPFLMAEGVKVVN